jgi:hypothetical protein
MAPRQTAVWPWLGALHPEAVRESSIWSPELGGLRWEDRSEI